MGVGGDFLAEQFCRLDNGGGFIRKHLLAEAGADAAVDAAGRGELDHVGPARDLQADRAAAIFSAVAGIAGGIEIFAQLVAVAQRAIHVARGGGDRGAGIEDTRTGDLSVIDGVPKGEYGAVAVSQIAHRGEAGIQRLHAVLPGIEGLRGGRESDVFQLRGDAPGIGCQVNMGIDQAGQDVAVLEVEDADLLVLRRGVAGR